MALRVPRRQRRRGHQLTDGFDVATFAGAERGSRGSQTLLYHLCERVRAAEHASRGRYDLLECRHGLTEIVKRGAGVLVEHLRVNRPTLKVTYEDLVKDKGAGLERVAKFVSAGTGCDAAGFTYTGEEASWHVVHPHPMSSYVKDWAQVVSTLRGTRFEKFLAMDGSSAG